MKIEIRKAVVEDLPILLEFEQGIIAYERPFDETLKPDPINYYDIKEKIELSDSEVIVATHEGMIVGSSYISIRTANPYLDHTHFGYLGFMFVKPKYRGKGVNSMIIEALKSWAKDRGITELRLDVYAENDSALKAYEKVGFKPLTTLMRLGI